MKIILISFLIVLSAIKGQIDTDMNIPTREKLEEWENIFKVFSDNGSTPIWQALRLRNIANDKHWKDLCSVLWDQKVPKNRFIDCSYNTFTQNNTFYGVVFSIIENDDLIPKISIDLIKCTCKLLQKLKKSHRRISEETFYASQYTETEYFKYIQIGQRSSRELKITELKYNISKHFNKPEPVEPDQKPRLDLNC